MDQCIYCWCCLVVVVVVVVDCMDPWMYDYEYLVCFEWQVG